MRKFIILIAAAFAMAGSAQEKAAHDYGDFTVDAQVRARGEYRGGMSSDGNVCASPSDGNARTSV